jgi:hypothetical protein
VSLPLQVVSSWLAQYLPFKIISKSSVDLLAEVSPLGSIVFLIMCVVFGQLLKAV